MVSAEAAAAAAAAAKAPADEQTKTTALSPIQPTSLFSSSTTAAATIGGLCSTPNCANTATLACPTCLQLKLSPSLFCSQSCFKSSWSAHNAAVHKPARARQEFRAPTFNYTGSIRPHYVTPIRSVPSHIKKPDHADDGVPREEIRIRNSPSPIHINSPAEIAGIRAACQLGRKILDMAGRMVRVGITTEEIDIAVHNATIEANAYPSPLNYYHFPKSCCTSINEVICHGIPDARPLQHGDIINIDVSVFLNGFHGDLNEMYIVGDTDAESKRLIRTTHDALDAAIAMVKPGTMCREFGDVITRVVHKGKMSVVKSYVGHGVNKLFHAKPDIPHYARNKAVGILKAGMTLTIEPMVNLGSWRDVTWPDKWTSTTEDGRRSAQFEHTVLVTETGFEILTARTSESPRFWWENQTEENTNSDETKAQ